MAYDREYVVLLDGYLDHQPPDETYPNVPDYAGLLINGKLPSAAPTFDVAEGEQIRLRVANTSGAATVRVRLAGHTMDVAYKDGRPVDPVEVDAIEVSPGERYDVVVTADNPGIWSLQATSLNEDDLGDPSPALGVVDCKEVNESEPNAPSNGGRTLDYDDLVAMESYPGVDGEPDRRYRLRLSRGSASGSWAISNQLYPDAEWLDVHPGEHVRLIVENRSDMIHPMHLHGHFSERNGAIMDTAMVRPEETVPLDFYADNPGRWLFHCHNNYRLESGMARVIKYE